MANVENSRPQSSGENSRKWKKRQHPPVCNGIGAQEDKNSDFLCPICFEIISEAYMTKCGHTFCYNCIKTSIEHYPRCPKCNFTVESVEDLFPNFLLNELITKKKRKSDIKNTKFAKLANENGCFSELHQIVTKEKDNLSVEDINSMLEILAEKKHQLEIDCREAQLRLLQEFLQNVKSRKQEEMKQLQQQIHIIDSDLHVLQNNGFIPLVPVCEKPSTSKNCLDQPMQDGFNGSKYANTKNNDFLSVRRKRMQTHFNDLEKSYLSSRLKDAAFVENDIEPVVRPGLRNFSENLFKFTRYSTLRPLATLNYSNDHFNSSSIVSSIEFDKDNEYFGIAGVIKKIKIFEYATVIQDSIDLHYPVNEMVCSSKISCISWSSYHKGMLASSDYEGTVTLWDALTGQKKKAFNEHEKRCWSVDFNRVDTKLIASGSDDSKVKIWSTSLEHSVTSLETKANVCCVKFNPESRFHLAFGSADHCVHYYDLRNPKQPLVLFKGHKKAVSYVKFLNGEELVSASTDSHLRLWNVKEHICAQSFKGHINEKNFVGLATDGDFISCGSENNSLYVYYKSLASQVLTFRFDANKSILEKDKREDDSNEFVSAVCWRVGSNVLIAANSQGNIKVLELV